MKYPKITLGDPTRIEFEDRTVQLPGSMVSTEVNVRYVTPEDPRKKVTLTLFASELEVDRESSKAPVEVSWERDTLAGGAQSIPTNLDYESFTDWLSYRTYSELTFLLSGGHLLGLDRRQVDLTWEALAALPKPPGATYGSNGD